MQTAASSKPINLKASRQFIRKCNVSSATTALQPIRIPAGKVFGYLSQVTIKRYSNKEPLVFLWIMVPYIIFMNIMMFGGCIFHSIPCFFKSFGISTLYFFLIYGLFGSFAVLIKNKNPGAGDLFRRVRIMLPMFYVMNIGAVYGAYWLYNATGWIDCPARPHMIWWTILYGCVMSTVITFINEGMANWEKWKDSLSESEKLRNAYQRSKLLGLKGQINPHFLFNCFNTLSGLIQEDEEEAERFLNEMIKVHRYLLRGDDEYLVSLADEMKFAAAYLNLTKSRFGDAIRIDVKVPKEVLPMHIPPLSMQVILENIIYTNALSKRDPLHIAIGVDNAGQLTITHTLHEKIIVQGFNLDEGLDNLVTKYRLLNAEILIEEKDKTRKIILPLFATQQVAA